LLRRPVALTPAIWTSCPHRPGSTFLHNITCLRRLWHSGRGRLHRSPPQPGCYPSVEIQLHPARRSGPGLAGRLTPSLRGRSNKSHLFNHETSTLAVTALPLGPEQAARRRSDEDPPSQNAPASRVLEKRWATVGGRLSGGVDSKREHNSWSEVGGQDRQCPGPRGQQREGDQVSMSQRGSAPRPASHRSPKTSPDATFSSPRLSQPSPEASILPCDESRLPTHDAGGASDIVKREEGGGGPSLGGRTSDVHGILNASDSHHRYPGGVPAFPGQPTEGESARPGMGDLPPRGQGGPPLNPYVFQGQHPSAASRTGYPPPPPETVAGPSIQRGSPTTGPPLPPLAVPRRILTPKSPRVTSLSRAARRNEELQQNPLPQQPDLPEFPDVSPRSRPTALGAAAPRGQPQSQSIGTALPPPTLSPIAARSLSQPIIGHALPPTLAPDYLHPSNRPPLPGPGPARFPSQPPLGRDAATGGPGGETRWSTGSYGSLAGLPWGRGLPVGESQHLLTITPQYGEEIVVPVDTHQGSKTQDQKRQKNAIASARFRTRKKEREHQLEVDNHELGIRVRELEAEREFYRNERNRLREIVSRTPSISHWANGPPSPVSNREQGSLSAESGGATGPSHSQSGTDQSLSVSPAARRRRGPQPRSPPRVGGPYAAESSTMAGAPRPQGHPFPHPPTYSYGPSEPSMAEPPARRRRLDEPQFTTPAYGPPPPTTLPPMTAQRTFGLHPPRNTPTPPGLPRLPPLRIDQPSAGTEQLPQPQLRPVPGGPPPPPPLPQQAQHQQPYHGRPYETGWAVAQPPPGHQEGSQR